MIPHTSNNKNKLEKKPESKKLQQNLDALETEKKELGSLVLKSENDVTDQRALILEIATGLSEIQSGQKEEVEYGLELMKGTKVKLETDLTDSDTKISSLRENLTTEAEIELQAEERKNVIIRNTLAQINGHISEGEDMLTAMTGGTQTQTQKTLPVEISAEQKERIDAAFKDQDLRHVLHGINNDFPEIRTGEINAKLQQMKLHTLYDEKIIEAVEKFVASKTEAIVDPDK